MADFHSAKIRLLSDAMSLPTDATEEDKKQQRRYSLRRALVEDVISSAAIYSINNNKTIEEFEEYVQQGIAIIDDLRHALLPYYIKSPADWNFWSHERNPAKIVVENKTPYMDKDAIEACATAYLNLHYRSSLLERTLVDILVALEMYGFALETIGPRHEFPWPLRLPSSSPFHQKHALANYLIGTFWNALTCLGLVLIDIAIPNFSGRINVSWIVWTLVGIEVLWFWMATLLLPFVWWKQSKARLQIKEFLALMLHAYSELGSEGTLSTKRVREIVSKAADGGVIWPGPLYAILDDNISRLGRL